MDLLSQGLERTPLVRFSHVTHTWVHFSQLTHTLLHFSLLTATYPFLICNVNLCLSHWNITLKNFRHGPAFWLVRNVSVVVCLNRKELIQQRQKVTYEARQRGKFSHNLIGSARGWWRRVNCRLEYISPAWSTESMQSNTRVQDDAKSAFSGFHSACSISSWRCSPQISVRLPLPSSYKSFCGRQRSVRLVHRKQPAVTGGGWFEERTRCGKGSGSTR